MYDAWMYDTGELFKMFIYIDSQGKAHSPAHSHKYVLDI
jgi:hypothetical protein